MLKKCPSVNLFYLCAIHLGKLKNNFGTITFVYRIRIDLRLRSNINISLKLKANIKFNTPLKIYIILSVYVLYSNVSGVMASATSCTHFHKKHSQLWREPTIVFIKNIAENLSIPVFH